MINYGFVKVAAATCRIRVADPVYNRQAMEAKIEECMGENARLVVFPELCISGATCQDLFRQDSLITECRNQLEILAKKSAGWKALIFVGLPWKKGDRLYNVAAVLHAGRVLALIPKQNLPRTGCGSGYFTPGPAQPQWIEVFGENVFFGNKVVFAARQQPLLTVGCELGEDLWAANPSSARLAAGGANILVNPSASHEAVGRTAFLRELVTGTSRRLSAAYIHANAGEGESTQDLVFAGRNLIAENGQLLAEGRPFVEEPVYADIDLQRLSHERSGNASLAEEDPELTTIGFDLETGETDSNLKRTFARLPFVPEDPREKADRCEEIIALQAAGLKQRYAHIGCENAVIGISGGLDSTLALLVTVRTFDLLGLPRKQIRSVTMPCFGTTDRTYENACKLANILGTTLEEVNIKEAIRLHFQDIGHDENNHNVTYENSQARERTQVLMDIANRENALVIGTGDMSELALGWATYNGDHMSMYGVNAGVPKTLVRHLVDHYARTCGEEELQKVLLDIVDTPVSPELLPPVEGVISQKTEDLVGPYELHDFFLYHILRWGYEPEKVYYLAVRTFAGEYDAATVLKWLKTFYRRFFTQQFKRSCLPDGPKVGSVGLSPRGDLRMPSDASAALWLSRLEKIIV